MCNKFTFSITGTWCSIFSFASFYIRIHTPLVTPSPSELIVLKIVVSSILIWNGFCTYFNPAHFTCCQSKQQSQIKESWSCKFLFTFDRYPLAWFSSFVNSNYKLLLSFRGKIFFDELKLYISVKFSLLINEVAWRLLSSAFAFIRNNVLLFSVELVTVKKTHNFIFWLSWIFIFQWLMFS